MFLGGVGCVVPERHNTYQNRELLPPFLPSLDHTELKWTQINENMWRVDFEIKNTSDRPLEEVSAHISLYDKSGVLVHSEKTPIERYSMLPVNGRSPVKFHIITDHKWKKYSLRFSCESERPYTYVDINSEQVPSL